MINIKILPVKICNPFVSKKTSMIALSLVKNPRHWRVYFYETDRIREKWLFNKHTKDFVSIKFLKNSSQMFDECNCVVLGEIRINSVQLKNIEKQLLKALL